MNERSSVPFVFPLQSLYVFKIQGTTRTIVVTGKMYLRELHSHVDLCAAVSSLCLRIDFNVLDLVRSLALYHLF